jgi:hypothetical protein
MNNLSPILMDQRTIDTDHLNLLAIFHFVGAGLALIGILLLVAHYAMFQAFMNNPQMWANQKQTPPPPEVFAALKWFYVIFGSWFVGSALLNLISGFCIRARTHRAFSITVAAINCLHMPLGTLLGVFTIVVLMRESVRELYEAQQSGSV